MMSRDNDDVINYLISFHLIREIFFAEFCVLLLHENFASDLRFRTSERFAEAYAHFLERSKLKLITICWIKLAQLIIVDCR